MNDGRCETIALKQASLPQGFADLRCRQPRADNTGCRPHDEEFGTDFAGAMKTREREVVLQTTRVKVVKLVIKGKLSRAITARLSGAFQLRWEMRDTTIFVPGACTPVCGVVV